MNFQLKNKDSKNLMNEERLWEKREKKSEKLFLGESKRIEDIISLI